VLQKAYLLTGAAKKQEISVGIFQLKAAQAVMGVLQGGSKNSASRYKFSG
jgi:hypothetical protein